MVVLFPFERQIFPFATNFYVSLPFECLVVLMICFHDYPPIPLYRVLPLKVVIAAV